MFTFSKSFSSVSVNETFINRQNRIQDEQPVYSYDVLDYILIQRGYEGRRKLQQRVS